MHRGACGCDPQTGDGAGILIQIPHGFFASECEELGFTLPAAGEYGVGMIFLPVDPHERILAEGILETIIGEEGLTVLGWRDTPINGNMIGRVARNSRPFIEQRFSSNVRRRWTRTRSNGSSTLCANGLNTPSLNPI